MPNSATWLKNADLALATSNNFASIQSAMLVKYPLCYPQLGAFFHLKTADNNLKEKDDA